MGTLVVRPDQHKARGSSGRTVVQVCIGDAFNTPTLEDMQAMSSYVEDAFNTDGLVVLATPHHVRINVLVDECVPSTPHHPVVVLQVGSRDWHPSTEDLRTITELMRDTINARQPIAERTDEQL